MTQPVLEAQKVRQVFGDFVAVNDVSLQVMPNTIHAVIGPNGAGKTTFLNMLSGVTRPRSGKVLFLSGDVTRLPVHRRVHLGMSKSFQITNVYQDLSAYENIRLAVQAMDGAESRTFWRTIRRDGPLVDRSMEVLETVGLLAHHDRKAAELSHGGQRALEIGMAIASKPKLVFLDEPLAGMSIDDIQWTRDLIESLKSQMTIVFIEHNMSVVMGISDVISVLARGTKIAEGPPLEVSKNDAVREAYLGHS